MPIASRQPIPCPFDGKRAELTDWGSGQHYVRCSHCGVTTRTYRTPAEAVAVWNARVPVPPGATVVT